MRKNIFYFFLTSLLNHDNCPGFTLLRLFFQCEDYWFLIAEISGWRCNLLIIKRLKYLEVIPKPSEEQ